MYSSPFAPVKNKRPKRIQFPINAKTPSKKNRLSFSIKPKDKRAIQRAGGVFVPGGRGSANNTVTTKIINPLKTLTGKMLLIKDIRGLISFSAFARNFCDPLKKVSMWSLGKSLEEIFLGRTGSLSTIIKKLMNAMMIPKSADSPNVGIGKIKGQERIKVRNAFPLTPKFLINFSTVSGSFSASWISCCRSFEREFSF